jgi:hypothetical protein
MRLTNTPIKNINATDARISAVLRLSGFLCFDMDIKADLRPPSFT